VPLKRIVGAGGCGDGDQSRKRLSLWRSTLTPCVSDHAPCSADTKDAWETLEDGPSHAAHGCGCGAVNVYQVSSRASGAAQWDSV
jgi:hypothetical protein